MKTSLRELIARYRVAYKRVNKYEPIISSAMTAGELAGHIRYWQDKFIEQELAYDSEPIYPYGTFRGEN